MRIFATTLFFLIVLSLSAAADCPMNHWGTGLAGHGIQYDTIEPQAGSNGVPVVPGAPCQSCYTWPSGYFRVSGYAASDWGSWVNAEDRFLLVGPSSTTPLSFSVRLRVTGSVGAYVTGSAGIADLSGGSAVKSYYGGESPSNELVILPLQHLPDDPFNLKVDLSVGTGYPYSAGDLQTYLEFFDVPAGWSIVSCQGYDVPVPAQVTTWGSVRALYR